METFHKIARLLLKNDLTIGDTLKQVALIIAPVWRQVVVRITLGNVLTESGKVPSEPKWCEKVKLRTTSGERGLIEIFCSESRPVAAVGSETDANVLLGFVADLLGVWLERRTAEEQLYKYHAELEGRVSQRTVELREHQARLRKMSVELSLAEERERRAIAVELHDHVGQNLALMRMKLSELRGDAIFQGFDRNLLVLQKMLEESITSTRSLTFALSSPVLYELGLEAALTSFVEQVQTKHSLKIALRPGPAPDPADPFGKDRCVLLYKATRELVTNVIKHAKATETEIAMGLSEGHYFIRVTDNGIGFDLSSADGQNERDRGFGLFSIQERLAYAGGGVEISSEPGKGTTITLTVPK